MEEKPESISTKQILETASTTLERLGYGAPAPQTTVNVHSNPQVAVTVSPDVLFEARERMRQVQQINADTQPVARQLPSAQAPAGNASPSIEELFVDLPSNG